MAGPNPSAFLHVASDGTTAVARGETPQCPRRLPAAAKRVWQRIVPGLAATGILAASDAEALGHLCFQQAMLERLEKDYWREGPMLEQQRHDANGNLHVRLVVNPKARLVRETTTLVCRLINDFGLTPRARAALGDNLRNAAEQPQETPVTRPNPRLRAVE
jgi:P27 family predicted phage terminase small subunit